MIGTENSPSPTSSSRMKHKIKSQNLEGDGTIEDSWRDSGSSASSRRALQKRGSGVTEPPFDLNPNLVPISETNIIENIYCIVCEPRTDPGPEIMFHSLLSV